jgi:hypothetical protein
LGTGRFSKDPLTLAAVTAMLIVTSLVARYLLERRAARVDSLAALLVALRYQ